MEGMTAKQTMKLKILELSNGPIHSKLMLLEAPSRKKCFISLGILAKSMVSASQWLRGIETYTILWYLTLVSANYASRNSSVILTIRYAFHQNLTRAVNSPVAFKSSLTSAVVRSFGVVTRSILVTPVCSMAFVNVWSKKKVVF